MALIRHRAFASFHLEDDFVGFEMASFEVIGGAYRSIDLAQTDKMSIESEMEQARACKNINFYKRRARISEISI